MKPHGTYDTAFQAGAASRDVEVAKWKDAYLKVVERIHMVGGYLDQIKERDQLREQVKMLRDALDSLICMDVAFQRGPMVVAAVEVAQKALAATEPTSGAA